MSEIEKCGAECRDGTPCESYPVRGAERCRMHGGKGSGNPDAEGAGITHGARSDPTNLYEHLGDEAAAWVDGKVEAYLDGAGLSRDTPSGDLTELAVVTMYQARSGHAELAEEGLGRTKVVGVSEVGTPITDEEEHYLNKVVSRHSTNFRMLLKDAGVLDDPMSQQAGAIGDLAVEIGRTHVTEENIDEYTGSEQ